MKIPEHAKKVFSGIIFDVYQREQEMFDGSTDIFEAIKRPYSVQIVAITEDKKILICRETQPAKDRFIGLFAGRIEKGENHFEGAKRELLEESGYISDNWHFLEGEDYGNSKIEWLHFSYMALDCKKVDSQRLDPGEKIEVLEYEIDDFFDNYENILTDIFYINYIKKNLEKIRSYLK
ncbi:MAG: NUDIX hydrolase [Candidatus Gracilibacteria bacterium]|nr:NUDIX hydrolase [Candidatus Gracilibacteria bacterium]MDD4531011.1 NUDIX hydrolase [Candidatus Gracilibacteria bacterium]